MVGNEGKVRLLLCRERNVEFVSIRRIRFEIFGIRN